MGWFLTKLILKTLKLVIRHQFNNIKLSFFASHVKLSFAYYVRILDSLDTFIILWSLYFVPNFFATFFSNLKPFSSYFESILHFKKAKFFFDETAISICKWYLKCLKWIEELPSCSLFVICWLILALEAFFEVKVVKTQGWKFSCFSTR